MVVGADLCLLSSDDFDENRISENDFESGGFSLDFNVDTRPHEEEEDKEEEEPRRREIFKRPQSFNFGGRDDDDDEAVTTTRECPSIAAADATKRMLEIL